MRPPLLAAIALSLSLGACASPRPPDRSETNLLSVARAPISASALATGRTSAERFASAYARSIYDPTPPRLPASTPAVALSLRAGASRIPHSRRGLSARAAALVIRPLDSRHLSVSVLINDDRSRSFNVGFTLSLRRGRWFVTQISPPG